MKTHTAERLYTQAGIALCSLAGAIVGYVTGGLSLAILGVIAGGLGSYILNRKVSRA